MLIRFTQFNYKNNDLYVGVLSFLRFPKIKSRVPPMVSVKPYVFNDINTEPIEEATNTAPAAIIFDFRSNDLGASPSRSIVTNIVRIFVIVTKFVRIFVIVTKFVRISIILTKSVRMG